MVYTDTENMIKITDKVSYKIIKYLLEKGRFRQLEVSKATGSSFAWVNEIVNWLADRGYIAKRKEGYEVTAPASILNLFPLYRKMEKLRVEAFDLDMHPKAVAELLKEHKAVICLTSALQHYDDYFRDPAMHAYFGDPALTEELREIRKGYTHVEIYDDDLKDESDFVKRGGLKMTSELRTLIDLFCSNKAYAAERLVIRKWRK